MSAIQKTVIILLILSLASCASIERMQLKKENLKWETIGISSKRNYHDNTMNPIKYWKKAGVKTPQEASQWLAIGVTSYKDLSPWLMNGKANLSKAKEWKKAGFKLDENDSAYYIKEGYTSPKKAMVQKQWDDMQLGYRQEYWKKQD